MHVLNCHEKRSRDTVVFSLSEPLLRNNPYDILYSTRSLILLALPTDCL